MRNPTGTIIARQTGSATSLMFSAARSLAVESGRLKTEVQNFLSTVRAA